MFTQLGCKDIGIRKREIVANTQFLDQNGLISNILRHYIFWTKIIKTDKNKKFCSAFNYIIDFTMDILNTPKRFSQVNKFRSTMRTRKLI